MFYKANRHLLNHKLSEMGLFTNEPNLYTDFKWGNFQGYLKKLFCEMINQLTKHLKI